MVNFTSNIENDFLYPILSDETSFIQEEKKEEKLVIDETVCSDIVGFFVQKLEEDNIRYDSEIKLAIAGFFIKALKHRLYNDDEESKKAYADEIAVKLEFQLMIDGAECVKKSDIEKLTEDILGNLPNNDGEEGFNVVAILDDENDEFSAAKKRFATMLSTDRKSGSDYNEVIKSRKKDNNQFVLPKIDYEKGCKTVLEALKIGGKYPTKRDNNGNDIANMDYINALQAVIPADSNILFACYGTACYDEMSKMSKNDKGIYKPSFINNVIQIVAITESKIYICKSLYETTVIEIERCDVKSINAIFEKKIDSLGQIQFELSNNWGLILSVDKPQNSNGKEKEIFEITANAINSIFEKEIKKSEEDEEFVESVKYRYMKKERLIGLVLDGDESPFEISDMNKMVIKTIVEMTKPLYEKMIENPSESIEKFIFTVQESVVDKKLNSLIGEEIFPINDSWENNEDLKPLVDEVTSDLTKSLDELEKEIRSRFSELLSNEESSSKEEITEEDCYKALDALIGIEDAKLDIKNIVDAEKLSNERQKRGLDPNKEYVNTLCFVGNKGAGKSSVARILGGLMYANGLTETTGFVEVEDSDFDQESEGDIDNIFEIVKQHCLGGYALFSDADKIKEKPFADYIVAKLLSFIEENKGSIRVIIAGRKESMLNFLETNNTLKELFSTIISFEDISLEELLGVFVSIMKKNQFSIEPEAFELLAKYIEIRASEPDFANINTILDITNRLVDIHIQYISETKDEKNLRTFIVKDILALNSSIA